MGGDGQLFTNKRKLLSKSKLYTVGSEEQSTQDERANTSQRFQNCALKLEPLSPPIAFDLEGNLYSYKNVFEYLMQRKKNANDPDLPVAPFKKLSEVQEVFNDQVRESGEIECPLTKFSSFSGTRTFSGFWNCGHVFARCAKDSARGDTKEGDTGCPVCGGEGFEVGLILPANEAAAQRVTLKSHLKLDKKRGRDETENSSKEAGPAPKKHKTE